MGEVDGGKGERLGKGDVRVEGGGNWEEREGGAVREGGGRVVATEGEPMDMELEPGTDRGLDTPVVSGGAPTAAATTRGGVGLAGGVVSIPLSSIIFLAFYPSPDCSC